MWTRENRGLYERKGVLREGAVPGAKTADRDLAARRADGHVRGGAPYGVRDQGFARRRPIIQARGEIDRIAGHSVFAIGVAACPRLQRPLPIHQCYQFPLNSNMSVGQMIRRNPI